MDFIERSTKGHLQVDDSSFKIMLDYCVDALKTCDRNLIVPLLDMMLKGVVSMALPHFNSEKTIIQFLSALEKRVLHRFTFMVNNDDEWVREQQNSF